MTKIIISDQFAAELSTWGKSTTVEFLKSPQIKPLLPSMESWHTAGNLIKGTNQ